MVSDYAWTEEKRHMKRVMRLDGEETRQGEETMQSKMFNTMTAIVHMDR